MYAQLKCPCCGKEFPVKISIGCLEKQTFDTPDQAKRYILDNVQLKIVSDTELPSENQ